MAKSKFGIALTRVVIFLVILGYTPLPLALADDEVRIGAVLSLTGPAQYWGQHCRMAMELAVEEVNARGGANGKELRLIVDDAQSKATSGIGAFNKLVGRDRVEVIVGDVWAFLTNPLIPLSAREKVVLISPTVMDDSITEDSPYFFTFGHRFVGLEDGIRQFFEAHSELKTLGIIGFEDAWNDAYVRVVERVAKSEGIEVTHSVRTNDFNSDFRSEVLAIRKAQPKMVFSTWKPDTIRQRMMEINFDRPLLTSSDAIEAIRQRSASPKLLEGVYFLNWEPAPSFVAAFKERFKTEPYSEAHNAYEIVQAIARAVESGTGDMRQSLLKLNYQGVGGPIDFREAPNVNRADGQLFVIRDGVPVRP